MRIQREKEGTHGAPPLIRPMPIASPTIFASVRRNSASTRSASAESDSGSGLPRPGRSRCSRQYSSVRIRARSAGSGHTLLRNHLQFSVAVARVTRILLLRHRPSHQNGCDGPATGVVTTSGCTLHSAAVPLRSLRQLGASRAPTQVIRFPPRPASALSCPPLPSQRHARTPAAPRPWQRQRRAAPQRPLARGRRATVPGAAATRPPPANHRAEPAGPEPPPPAQSRRRAGCACGSATRGGGIAINPHIPPCTAMVTSLSHRSTMPWCTAHCTRRPVTHSDRRPMTPSPRHLARGHLRLLPSRATSIGASTRPRGAHGAQPRELATHGARWRRTHGTRRLVAHGALRHPALGAR